MMNGLNLLLSRKQQLTTNHNMEAREIILRAWDSKLNRMNIDLTLKDISIWGLSYNNILATYQRVETLIWMQYTGQKDVDGKRIYEGDIIEYPIGVSSLNKKVRQQVVYNIDGFQVTGIKKVKIKHYTEVYGFPNPHRANYSLWKKAKVIGNIYENKNLLN